MAVGRSATFLRLGKPILAGLALAYLVTAFVDKPAPVHFQPGNPYAAQQAAIVEPEANLVVERNIMKLGSPLSVTPDEGVPDSNPLAALEKLDQHEAGSATAEGGAVLPADGNATVPASIEDAGRGGAKPVEAPAVRKEVDTIPIPAPDAQ